MILFETLLATIIVSLLSLSGALFLSQKKFSQQTHIAYFVSFAAGVMLANALMDLLPHAIEEGDIHQILSFTLWGIVGSFLFERFILWHHHHEEKHHIKPSAFLVLFGDAIHNFVDGVVITASFLVSPTLGISTTLAIIAHEIPQEFADLSILLYAGFTRQKALYFNLLSSITAIIGAICAYFFLGQYEQYLPYVLGIAAGMFIYIACADLIPELHQEHHGNDRKSQLKHTATFIVGVCVILLLVQLVTE